MGDGLLAHTMTVRSAMRISDATVLPTRLARPAPPALVFGQVVPV